MGITNHALAKAIDVDPMIIHRITKEERGITPDTAIRLSRYFETTPEFWLTLQTRYELEQEEIA